MTLKELTAALAKLRRHPRYERDADARQPEDLDLKPEFRRGSLQNGKIE